MHTQKRELRIWHGINQVAHQPFAALNQFIVLATERNDSRLAFLAGQTGDAVAMQPGAVHEVPAGKLTLGCRPDPLATALLEPRDARAGLHVTAIGRDASLEFAANCRVIDDALLRHAQRSDAADVRLALKHRLAPEKLDALKSVLPAALLEFAQALQLGVVARHDQFAADLMRDVGFPAKLDHLPDAPHGENGLGRARLVIEAAMQHAAVVAALVAANFRLLFEQANAAPRLHGLQPPRRRQADNASADDKVVRFHPCTQPRSTSISWPVTAQLASLARNNATSATSSG